MQAEAGRKEGRKGVRKAGREAADGIGLAVLEGRPGTPRPNSSSCESRGNFCAPCACVVVSWDLEVDRRRPGVRTAEACSLGLRRGVGSDRERKEELEQEICRWSSLQHQPFAKSLKKSCA